jgi:hypothetical protein
MGDNSMPSDAASTSGRGRRSRVAGGFPFQCRVALTERDGARLSGLAERENLSVGAFASQLVERHLAGASDPLPVAAHDVVAALNAVSTELRSVLREARAEGGLFNQIARHLNTDHHVPDALAGLLGRTLVRHQATTTALDDLLTRTDRLLATTAAVLTRRPHTRGGPG